MCVCVGVYSEKRQDFWLLSAYRGEFLGLMVLHLILLAANKVAPELEGQVQIYSDYLVALNKVTTLPNN